MNTIRTRTLVLILVAVAALAVPMILRLMSSPPALATAERAGGREGQPETATPSPAESSPVVDPTARPVESPDRTVVPLWSVGGETRGRRLDPKSMAFVQAKQEGVKIEGRSAQIDPDSLARMAELQRGDIVAMPLLGGEQVEGKVNVVQQEASGWVRIGGELRGPRSGNFSLGINGGKVGGTILLRREEIAYVITGQGEGGALIQEKHLSEVICFPIPRPKNEPLAARQSVVAQSIPPILSSRPSAAAVLYLDFDGETVTDPAWNSGNTIVAAPAALGNSEITEVWSRVKEDFLALTSM